MKGKVDEKNWMIIRVTDMDLKDALLTKAAKLGLSISNDGETKTGIEHIALGNSISVGTSDKFHVNWARNIDYYANRGIVPVYDLVHDWAKIVDRLNSYAASVEKGGEVDNVTSLGSGDNYKIIGNSVIFNGDFEFTADEIATLRKAATLGVNISFNEESEEMVIEGSDNSVVISVNELDVLSNELAEAEND